MLPTEDLYHTAGWTTPLGSYLEGGRAEDAGAGARVSEWKAGLSDKGKIGLMVWCWRWG